MKKKTIKDDKKKRDKALKRYRLRAWRDRATSVQDELILLAY